MISITKLSDNFEIVDLPNDTQLSKAKLKSLAGGYQRLFKENNLTKGDRIGLAMQEDSHHLAAVFAAIDYGLVIVISGEHSLTDEYVERTKIKVIMTRGIQPCTVFAKNVIHINLDKIKFKEDNNYIIDPTEIMVEAYTSGTTGWPKCIAHTHKSILAASDNSIKHYWQNAENSWFFHNIVHLGVSSVYFFPSLFASKRIILPPLNDSYNSEALQKYKPNIMLVFPVHFQNFLKLQYEDLSYVDYVLTGGSTIPYNFCKRLIRQGVKNVAVIYGLTECLPPLIHKIVNKDNVNDYDQSEIGHIIDNTGKYSINDDILTITSSKHLCTTINNEPVKEFITNDVVSIDGNTFYFEKRNSDLIRINDTLVNPQQLVPSFLDGYCCVFSTSQTHVVVCIKHKDVLTTPVIQKLEANGITYDKIITDIELNVLGKPNIKKLREIYEKNKGTS